MRQGLILYGKIICRICSVYLARCHAQGLAKCSHSKGSKTIWFFCMWQKKAANVLGISLTTLYNKVKKIQNL